MKIKPIELIRWKETIWVENYKGKSLIDASITKALAKRPILIERSIVISGDNAIIGRDIDILKDFF